MDYRERLARRCLQCARWIWQACLLLNPYALWRWDDFWSRCMLWYCTVRSRLVVDPGEKQRLLEWVRSNVSRVRPPTNLGSDWKDGVVMCALLESLAPGSCPRYDLLNPDHALPNAKMAVMLVEWHMGIRSSLTAEEMVDFGPSSERKLMVLLSQLRLVSSRSVLRKPMSIPAIEGPEASEVQPERGFQPDQECAAKGMGLTQAVKGRKACFNIYLKSTSQLNIVIEIKGPDNSLCSERITNRSPKRKAPIRASTIGAFAFPSSGSGTDPVPRTVRSGSLGDVLEVERREIKIPFEYEIHCGRVSVGYIPVSTGKHKLSIIWQGQHIMGSPYVVSVDESLSGKEDAGATLSRQLTPEQSDDHLTSNQPTHGRILSEVRIAPARTRRLGTVTRRRILRHIVKVDGKDMVIEDSSPEEFASAVQALRSRETTNRPLSRQYSLDAKWTVAPNKELHQQVGSITPIDEAEGADEVFDLKKLTQSNAGVRGRTSSAPEKVIGGDLQQRGSESLRQRKVSFEDEGSDRSMSMSLSSGMNSEDGPAKSVTNSLHLTNGDTSSPYKAADQSQSRELKHWFKLIDEAQMERIKTKTTVEGTNEGDEQLVGNGHQYTEETLADTDAERTVAPFVLTSTPVVAAIVRDEVMQAEEKDAQKLSTQIMHGSVQMEVHAERELHLADVEVTSLPVLETSVVKSQNVFDDDIKLVRNEISREKLEKERATEEWSVATHAQSDIVYSTTERSDEEPQVCEMFDPNVSEETVESQCVCTLETILTSTSSSSEEGKVSESDPNIDAEQNPLCKQETSDDKIVLVRAHIYETDMPQTVVSDTYDVNWPSDRDSLMRPATEPEPEIVITREEEGFRCGADVLDHEENGSEEWVVVSEVDEQNYVVELSSGPAETEGPDVEPFPSVERRKELFEKMLAHSQSSSYSAKRKSEPIEGTFWASPVRSCSYMGSLDESGTSSPTTGLSSRSQSQGSLLMAHCGQECDSNVFNKTKDFWERNNVSTGALQDQSVKSKPDIHEETGEFKRTVRERMMFWESISESPKKTVSPPYSPPSKGDTVERSLTETDGPRVDCDGASLKEAGTSPETLTEDVKKGVARQLGSPGSEGTADSGVCVRGPSLVYRDDRRLRSKSVPTFPGGLQIGTRTRRSGYGAPMAFVYRQNPLFSLENKTAFLQDDCSVTDTTCTDDRGYIDDEIPDYASILMDKYVSFTGLLENDRCLSRRELLGLDFQRDEDLGHSLALTDPFPKNDSSALLPRASACRVYGAGVYYGQVGTRNHFQVGTRGAGKGCLTVSVQGPGQHDVNEVVVSYAGDHVYEVMYDVAEPGYYVISVKWSEWNISESPFICKVTY